MGLVIYSPEVPKGVAVIAGDRDSLVSLYHSIAAALGSGSDVRDHVDQHARPFGVEVRFVGVRSETARQVYPGRDVPPSEFQDWPSCFVAPEHREQDERKWLLL